jgi:hypothetical protein
LAKPLREPSGLVCGFPRPIELTVRRIGSRERVEHPGIVSTSLIANGKR